MDTALGTFAVRRIPATGVVPIKPIAHGGGHGGGLGSIAPEVGDIRIVDTSKRSLTMQAEVNFTNPTMYAVFIPFIDMHFLVNGTVLGHLVVKDMAVTPGRNERLIAQTIYDPESTSGDEGLRVGKEWLSQYVSGFDTTLSVRPHEGTLPLQPSLGKALGVIEFNVSAPRLGSPSRPGDGGDGDDGPHLIKDATMHLLSSTASFTLVSPLTHTTMYITHLNATAYHHSPSTGTDDPVGTIDHDMPFAVPPGESRTPRLPVAWGLDGVGYDAVRSALGGQLKLIARATVGIRIGRFEERLWYIGRSIGAHIRL